MTHDRWRDVVQYLPATSSVRRCATFLHCHDVMEFRSEFWCSRNCSSTMRAFPGSALRVIWYFYHTADRSCDISFVHFRIFFIKTPIRVKRIPWGHFAWFWKGLHVYFWQIVVLVWQINAYRVYDKKLSQIIISKGNAFASFWVVKIKRNFLLWLISNLIATIFFTH
jgi:hypothetical protein